jgi:hypothetical protein
MFPLLAAGDLWAIHRWAGGGCSAAHAGLLACQLRVQLQGRLSHTNAHPQRGAVPLIRGPHCRPCSELRSIHLRTLNKERAEIIAQHWLQEGRVPTPRQARSAACA